MFASLIISALAVAGVSQAAVITERAIEARGCSPPNVDAAAIALIEKYEGWVDHAYLDPTGHWTIGYGHLCSRAECTDVPYPKPLSKANGEKLLQADLKIAEACVAEDISSKIHLNANQYGALVSWAFNVGCGNVKTSTLIAELNKGDNPDAVAAAQLPLWDESDGEVLPGLKARRAAEVALFKTATKTGALPAKGC